MKEGIEEEEEAVIAEGCDDGRGDVLGNLLLGDRDKTSHKDFVYVTTEGGFDLPNLRETFDGGKVEIIKLHKEAVQEKEILAIVSQIAD